MTHKMVTRNKVEVRTDTYFKKLKDTVCGDYVLISDILSDLDRVILHIHNGFDSIKDICEKGSSKKKIRSIEDILKNLATEIDDDIRFVIANNMNQD